MSRSRAEVRLLDGTILHGVYDGTGCDCVPTKLYMTQLENLREGMAFLRCVDPEWHEHVPARLYHWYGGGDAWDTEVCPKCRCITGPVSAYYPYDVDYYNNVPSAEIDSRAREYKEKLHKCDMNFYQTWYYDPESPWVKSGVYDVDDFPGGRKACFSAQEQLYSDMILKDFNAWKERICNNGDDI